MNKRKVLSILLLALITVTLAVSCSSNIDTPAANTEELSYVTFGNGHSRELGTSYTTVDYDELFWFYTATKKDNYGTTGVTTAKTPVSKGDNDAPAKGLSGRVGPFSQGAWNFTLYAYKEASKSTLVYKSDVVPVILKGGDVKNVPVSVTTQGGTGTLEVKDAYFRWLDSTDNPIGQGGGNAKPSIKFSLIDKDGVNVANSVSITFEDKDQDGKFYIKNNEYIYTIPVGYYTGIVSVYLNGPATDGTTINNEGTPVYTQSFGVRIYGNATTYISGNMVEGVDSKVTFDVPEQEMVIFTVEEDNNTNVTVPVSPKDSSGSDTVVSFPSGALDTSAVHQLNVTVTPTASAEQKFQISSTTGNAAVAGIDLTMVKVQKNADGSTQEVPVTSFGKDSDNKDRQVTITTYIATGLNSVQVKYLNEQGQLEDITDVITNTTNESTVPYYNPTSGKLIFTTTHFSQYVVVSPVEALNVNTGVPYTSLVTAIADAKDGQEVKVMKVVNVNSTIVVDKNLTLDLNGKNINATLSGISGSNPAISLENATLTIKDSEGNGKIVSDEYGIMASYGGTIIVESGTIESNYAALSGNNLQGDMNFVINGGTLTSRLSEAIYMPGQQTLTITNGTLNGGISARMGQIIISGGTVNGMTAEQTSDSFDDYWKHSGSAWIGDAIYVWGGTYDSENEIYGNSCNITITGGTINGNAHKAIAVYDIANKYDQSITVDVSGNAIVNGDIIEDHSHDQGTKNVTTTWNITGGRFSSDPTAYVAEMYCAEPQTNNTFIVKKATNWIQLADTSWYGDGTASEFTISNAKELAGLAQLVTSGKNFSGRTVELDADINLKGLNWVPVGGGTSSGKKFQGTFDGLNHTISNMSAINNFNYGNGFFGDASGSTIKNVTFDNAFVSRYKDLAYSGNVYGIVAGYAYGKTTFENVTVQNSKISGFGKVGGILGMAADPGTTNTTFKDCSVNNVWVCGYYNVGGLSGNIQNVLVIDNTPVPNVTFYLGGEYIDINNYTINSDEECGYNGKQISGKYWPYLDDEINYLYGASGKYAVMYGENNSVCGHELNLNIDGINYVNGGIEFTINSLDDLSNFNHPCKPTTNNE